MIRAILMAMLVLLSSGCNTIPYKELIIKRQEFIVPVLKSDNSVLIYFITPHGYYLPLATYEIQLNGEPIKISTSSHSYLVVSKKSEYSIKYRYYYYSYMEGKRSNWKTKIIKFDNPKKRLFLFFRDVRISELTEQEAIDEMIEIDYFNEKIRVF